MKITLNPKVEAETYKKGQILQSAPSGVGDALYLEPLLFEILSQFSKLMISYNTDDVV